MLDASIFFRVYVATVNIDCEIILTDDTVAHFQRTGILPLALRINVKRTFSLFR